MKMNIIFEYELSSKYVESFGNLAKETNTLILPADAGDIPKMVTTALATFESVKNNQIIDKTLKCS